MKNNNVPYPRKGLYLLFTVPMIFIYILIAAHLWAANIAFFIVYFAFFILMPWYSKIDKTKPEPKRVTK